MRNYFVTHFVWAKSEFEYTVRNFIRAVDVTCPDS
jgi:hypothetical protein